MITWAAAIAGITTQAPLKYPQIDMPIGTKKPTRIQSQFRIVTNFMQNNTLQNYGASLNPGYFASKSAGYCKGPSRFFLNTSKAG